MQFVYFMYLKSNIVLHFREFYKGRRGILPYSIRFMKIATQLSQTSSIFILVFSGIRIHVTALVLRINILIRSEKHRSINKTKKNTVKLLKLLYSKDIN